MAVGVVVGGGTVVVGVAVGDGTGLAVIVAVALAIGVGVCVGTAVGVARGTVFEQKASSPRLTPTRSSSMSIMGRASRMSEVEAQP